MNEITLDFETFSECSLKSCGAYVYSMHSSTIPILMSYKFNGEATQIWSEGKPFPKDLRECIERGDRIVAHNYWFEYSIWKNSCSKLGDWPKVKDSQWWDTMHQCGMHAIPLAMDKASAVLKFEEQKMAEGKALIKLFCLPNKDGIRNMPKDHPAKWELFKVYCKRDTDVTRDMRMTLISFKPTELNQNIPLTHKINSNGIPVDTESAQVILEKVSVEKASYVKRITELTGGVITTVNQTARMKVWLKSKFDIEVDNFQAGTVEKLLNGDFGKLPPDAYKLVEMRATGGKSSTAKFESIINTSHDNLIKGTVVYHGARTGRMAGRLFQPQNLPKPSVKYETMDLLIEDLVNMTNDEINEKYGSLMRAASSAVRGMIKPPEGHELYGADYAAIEARVLFWLANCQRGLNLYHRGFDVYKDMATEIYNVQYDAVDDDQRWLGKQSILGCGYGLGFQGFINACAVYGVEIFEEIARSVVSSYRETYWEVPKLWDSLDKSAITAMKSNHEVFAAHGRVSFKLLRLRNGVNVLYMKLPSNRLISYYDVRIETVKTPWGARRKAITYKVMENNMWRRTSTYGGKLTENACQAIARDIMMEGNKNAEDAGFTVFMQVHDELISHAPIDYMSLEDYEKLLCDPMPEWAMGLPLAAEGKILTRYQKL